MKIFKGLPTCFECEGTVLTIGIFDGVHLGHQQIMKDVVASSIKQGCTSLVITFDPHPEEVLFNKQMSFLTSLAQRIEIIEQLGIDALIVADFTHEIASLNPEEFVRELLVKRLKMKEIRVGADFGFGKQRQGNIELLKALGRELGFQVEVVKPVKAGNEIVSSTKIRNYLLAGDVQKAALLLGRCYSVKGKVIPGEKRGKTIGYPTANLDWEAGILLPALGVYAVEVALLAEVAPPAEVAPLAKVSLENKNYPGIANLGYKPTFDGEKISLEIYLFDFNQEIYSASLQVAFTQRLRGEKKFAGAQELAAQIRKDEIAAKEKLKDR